MFSQLLPGSSVVCNEAENHNLTNPYEVVENTQWLAYTVISPLIIAGGLLGNIINFIILSRPELRGVTYVYLLALAITDLGVMICIIPMIVRLNNFDYIKSWSSAFYHAHIELFLVNTFMASSIFIVCCMTVDRYISVCLPTKFRSVHTTKLARVSIVVSYCLALVVSLPLSALKTVCRSFPTGYSFEENFEITRSLPWLIYIWTSEIIVRLGPALTLTVLNFFIINKFTRLSAKRRRFHAASEKFRTRYSLDSCRSSGLQDGVRNRNYSEEKRLVVLLTSIIFMFTITMTPSVLLSLLYTQHLDQNLHFQIFRAVANNLELANFALNFFIYFFGSKEFRKVFHQVFYKSVCCCKTKTDLNN